MKIDCLSICAWHKNKMDFIAKMYRDGKIDFGKKLRYQSIVTAMMFDKMGN